jgi:NAD(P)-dependent dehydrogenase (short-subunit alcohol dehydrogenase family)
MSLRETRQRCRISWPRTRNASRPWNSTSPGPEQIAAAKSRCTDVNLLVNNAGINRGQGFLAAPSLEDARAEIETNYLGTLAMCRAFAPQLVEGALVNVLSILAKVTLPAMGSLCASKAASLRMTEGVRAELAAQGTLVVAVMTGALDTDMSRDFQGPKSSPAKSRGPSCQP